MSLDRNEGCHDLLDHKTLDLRSEIMKDTKKPTLLAKGWLYENDAIGFFYQQSTRELSRLN